MSSPKLDNATPRVRAPSRRPVKPARSVAAAPAAMPAKAANGGDPSAAAARLAADMERALADGRRELLTAEALQALMAAACKTYAAQIEAGADLLPLPARGATATDVMVTASGLLKAANLAVFELGMWQSWTGR